MQIVFKFYQHNRATRVVKSGHGADKVSKCATHTIHASNFSLVNVRIRWRN